MISSTGSAPKSTPQESWQDLFGSGPNGAQGFEGDSKRNKTRKTSRKSMDSLRISRSQSLNDRIGTLGDPPPPTPVAAGTSLVHLHSVTSPSTPSPSRHRQSMDDTTFLLEEERETRRRQLSRIGKARSAATIDTSGMLLDTPPPFMNMAPSPILSIAPSSTKASSTPSGGMDYSIKSIAAQMKQRREASGQADPLVSRASFSSTTSRSSEVSTKSLRKTTSSVTSGNGKSHSASNEPASSGLSSTPDAPLTGVAAMRARFEKK